MVVVEVVFNKLYMSKFNLIPMVYDHVDKTGIW